MRPTPPWPPSRSSSPDVTAAPGSAEGRGARSAVRSGRSLGVIGPAGTLGPVRVPGAAGWLRGAAGETVARETVASVTATGAGRGAALAAADPGTAGPG